MKQLSTLQADLAKVLDDQEHFDLSDEEGAALGLRLSTHFKSAISKREGKRELGKVWASDLGERCARRFWYRVNKPELGEKFTFSTKMKFLYGNAIEELLLELVKKAGHSVEGEQERMEHTTPLGTVISGRPDAIIDGHWSDVKSSSSFGFARYKREGITAQNDSFGYRDQLSFYHGYGSNPKADPKLTPFFLMMDKQLGHVAPIYLKEVIDKDTLAKNADALTTYAGVVDSLPPRVSNYEVPEGKGGNMKLTIKCSYCEFKKDCHPDARAFRYSKGITWLTQVKKQPKVDEIDRDLL